MSDVWRALSLALVLSLTAPGCSGTDEVERDESALEDDSEAPAEDGEGEATGDVDFGDGDAAEQASWTYLSYSMADTNLEDPMLADIEEMAEVGSGNGVNIVALVDRAAGETDREVLDAGDWETGKLFLIQQGSLEEIEDLGEVDMGDPQLLAEFIEFGVTNFPADNYALTISDHGGGWTGMGSDDSSGNLMDLSEIASGLEAGVAAAGIDKIDLLGFDACLMATYEVASRLAPYADYLLASEETEPGHGWDYRSLQVLADDPSTDAATLGATFVEGFAGQAAEQGTGADITLSLVDLAMVPALDEAMATFAGLLTEQAAALGPLIGRERAESIEYARSPNPAQSHNLVDLGAFVSEIGIESLPMSDAADAVSRAIGDAVVAETVGPARLGSTGLSIYFPPVAEFADPSYGETAQLAVWDQFLASYHSAGEAIPEDQQLSLVDGGGTDAGGDADAEGGEFIDGGEALVEFVEGGVDVSIQLDPATIGNVTEAVVSFGFVDPEDGAIVQLGDTEAEVLEDGTVIGFSDLTVLTITDEVGDTIDAYLSLEFDEESGLSYASVPLDYTDPETEELLPVDLSIVLDEEGTVIQEIYYLADEEDGTYGELQADPAGLVSPVVLVFLEDGTVEWQGYGDTALFADLPSLQYGLELLDSDTEIYVDITVTDFGGNELVGSATFFQE